MRNWTAAIVVTALLLAGCLGSSSKPEETAVVQAVAPKVSVAPPTNTSAPAAELPKFHPHNNWGDRTQVALFRNDVVRLGDEPPYETHLSSEDKTLIVGYAEFDTRMNGDDSASLDSADTVFQGTKELVTKVSWDTSDPHNQIPGLTFKFQPANSASFISIPRIGNGVEFRIPISRGWADMPHSLSLSRWRFALEAYDPQVADQHAPAQAFVAKGEARISMDAINGGTVTLDPPHPYFFLDGTRQPAGSIQKNLDTKVVRIGAIAGTASVPSPIGDSFHAGDDVKGWKMPAPYIVPWETTKLHAVLYYNYTGPASALTHDLALVYTDASGPDLHVAQAATSAGGVAAYEIPVGGNQADDPYATSSSWTWGVTPIVQGTSDVGGEFQGNVHLVLEAEGPDETGLVNTPTM